MIDEVVSVSGAFGPKIDVIWPKIEVVGSSEMLTRVSMVNGKVHRVAYRARLLVGCSTAIS